MPCLSSHPYIILVFPSRHCCLPIPILLLSFHSTPTLLLSSHPDSSVVFPCRQLCIFITSKCTLKSSVKNRVNLLGMFSAKCDNVILISNRIILVTTQRWQLSHSLETWDRPCLGDLSDGLGQSFEWPLYIEWSLIGNNVNEFGACLKNLAHCTRSYIPHTCEGHA